jgi:long-chain acyl-CoA synthetase
MVTDRILCAFERRLRRPGEAIVVSPSRRASVADVDRMARAMADKLDAAGAGEGALIALVAANGPAFLAGLLAVRRRRQAALLYDARTPAAEKARITGALGVAATLECRCAWPRSLADLGVVPAPGEPATLPPDTAVVKLTSGSTGCPRGIVTPEAALVADDAALAASMGLEDDERILASIPMSHSYGLSSVALPALMRRTVLVVPDAGGPLDPLAPARDHDVTFLPTVPAFLQALVKLAEPPRMPPSLRLVISAGAPLQAATAAAFRDLYGRPVHVFYGASECGGITYDRTGTAAERGTLGTPVDGVTVDLEAETGAVTVESPAVAAGYFPDPHPDLCGGRFRTSDQAAFRAGELVLEGRLDDVINVRGKKINPREIEAVLRRLAGVEEAVVLGVTPPGRDETVVRSFVVCRPGALCQAAVLAWCRRHLAGHKVPRSIVLLDEIPRTERGKLDRAALLAMERPVA